jgi:transposase-like protein
MNAATATTTTLSYRCPACGSEWTVTKASQPLSSDLQPTTSTS